jgi:hypothetical protein
MQIWPRRQRVRAFAGLVNLHPIWEAKLVHHGIPEVLPSEFCRLFPGRKFIDRIVDEPQGEGRIASCAASSGSFNGAVKPAVQRSSKTPISLFAAIPTERDPEPFTAAQAPLTTEGLFQALAEANSTNTQTALLSLSASRRRRRLPVNRDAPEGLHRRIR